MPEIRRQGASATDRRARLRDLKRTLSTSLSAVEKAEASLERATQHRARVVADADASLTRAEEHLGDALRHLAKDVGGQRRAQELTGLPAAAFRAATPQPVRSRPPDAVTPSA